MVSDKKFGTPRSPSSCWVALLWEDLYLPQFLALHFHRILLIGSTPISSPFYYYCFRRGFSTHFLHVFTTRIQLLLKYCQRGFSTHFRHLFSTRIWSSTLVASSNNLLKDFYICALSLLRRATRIVTERIDYYHSSILSVPPNNTSEQARKTRSRIALRKIGPTTASNERSNTRTLSRH